MAVTINADNGVSSGSAGLKQTADSTGVLALQTNGTTAVSISTGQVVTLTNALPVASGGTGQTTYTDGQLLVGNTTGNTLTKATLTQGTGVTVTNGSGSITLAIGQAVATSSNVQFNSLGVGTAGSGTTGEIRATNNVTAYYSDDRLKTNLGNIQDALSKVKTLNGFYYEANEVAQQLGYEVVREVGVSAQQVKEVLPEVVVPAPIDDKYLTVRYEKLIPLLIEAIKELENRLEILESRQ